jgi:hypothetical protein
VPEQILSTSLLLTNQAVSIEATTDRKMGQTLANFFAHFLWIQKGKFV